MKFVLKTFSNVTKNLIIQLTSVIKLLSFFREWIHDHDYAIFILYKFFLNYGLVVYVFNPRYNII